MQPNYHYRMAYMFREKMLDLSEVVKQYIVAIDTKMIPDSRNPETGYNVFDNSSLYQELILGILKAHPQEEALSYKELGDILHRHFQTIAKLVKNMVQKDYISTQFYSRQGALYTIKNDTHIQEWIIGFTNALWQLDRDPDIKKKIYEECANIRYKRGKDVALEEIGQKLRFRNHED